jgi:hypothetical protein
VFAELGGVMSQFGIWAKLWLMATFGESARLPDKKALEQKLCQVSAILVMLLLANRFFEQQLIVDSCSS